DRQAAALPHLSGCAEKPLRHMQSRRIKSSGESSSAGRNTEIIGSGKSGDGIQKDRYVFLMLHQAAGTLDDHLRNTLMMLRQLVKGGIDHVHILSLDRFLNISYFLRTFVDEENDQMHIRTVPEDGFGHIFQKSGLARLRRGNDHSSLSFADRTDQIHDPHGHCSSGTFHFKALTGEHRRHVFKIIPFLSLTRRKAVDRGHIKKRAELLSLRLDADASLEDISCFQIKTP